MKRRVVVVGGGIAGLAAAHRLTELQNDNALDLEVALLEGSTRLGGAIATEQVGDFLVEAGPDSFITEKPWALRLCERLGLGFASRRDPIRLPKDLRRASGQTTSFARGLLFVGAHAILAVRPDPALFVQRQAQNGGGDSAAPRSDRWRRKPRLVRAPALRRRSVGTDRAAAHRWHLCIGPGSAQPRRDHAALQGNGTPPTQRYLGDGFRAKAAFAQS